VTNDGSQRASVQRLVIQHNHLSLFSTLGIRMIQTQIGHPPQVNITEDKGGLVRESCRQALGSAAFHLDQGAPHPRLDSTSRGNAPIPPSRGDRRPKQAFVLASLSSQAHGVCTDQGEWPAGLAFSAVVCLSLSLCGQVYDHFAQSASLLSDRLFYVENRLRMWALETRSYCQSRSAWA
jgi:hypothetical protein